MLRNFLVNKKLNDLGLNKLIERHATINDLDRVQKLNKLSHKTLKELGKLQQVRNYDSLSKEDLIYVLLRSKNPNEDNYIKSITTNHDTSSLNKEIKAKIKDVRQLIILLSDILSRKEKNKIIKELYDILEKIRNTRLRKNQKEKILLTVIEIHNDLAKKERFMDLDYDDLQYHGISDILSLIYPVAVDRYYEPELIHSSFVRNYERYQIRCDIDKELSVASYLSTIRSNVEKLLDTQKVINNKKVQSDISTIFLNYLTNETTEKFTYSDNIELRSTDDAKERTSKLFNSLTKRYQETLENKMEGSSFVFDCVNFLDIKFQQTHLIRSSSYIKSPKWIQSKKATTNPQNKDEKDDKCFMYAITIALHHHEINNHPEGISQLIPYIRNDNLNWDRINFPAEGKDWKRFERNNQNIALNIFSAPFQKKQ